MIRHRRSTRALSIAVAAIAALSLTACGSDDDEPESSATTAAPSETTAAVDDTPVDDTDDDTADDGATDDGASGSGVDACALLDPVALGDLVTFEFGEGTWTEDPDPEPGTCSWTNDEQATTLTVEVLDGIDETMAGLEAGTGTELEEIPIGASTATGVRDVEADRLISLYLLAGADNVVKVTQSPLKIDDDAMIAVGEAAAIAFENLPTGATDDGAGSANAGGGAGGEAAPSGGLESVAFTVQSSDAGIDLTFEVTADEVAETGNPVTTTIVCAGDEAGDTGIFEGVYAVAASDLDRTDGLVLATIESLDAVDGPGTYPGRLNAQDSDGRSVEVDGDLTIDDGLRAGELVGQDDSGNAVVATFECRPVG